MVAIHYYLGLNNGYNGVFLAKSSVSRQQMHISFNISFCGDAITYSNYGTPFGKSGAKVVVFFNPLPKAVKTLGNLFAGKISHINRSFINFNTWDDACFLKD